MSLITRLGTALILLATTLPFAASTVVANSKSCQRTSSGGYSEKSCCLPNGGPPKAPTPPTGHDCPPSSHYWSTNQGCCVPRSPSQPNHPPPQCKDGWTWYPGLHMCLQNPTPPSTPPSKPSGGHGWKRNAAHKRSAPLCPSGLDACPISGLNANDFECIDTTVELESCGGCASLGQGQDCTAIKGAWNVGCEQGRCAVYTCTFGYKRTHDGQSCVPL
ncbi:hypothetical protein B0H10DRAFT_2058505 [Mycena sp. CBHHK59/15]|nr:hypothetical protein B0H10DRAFT_2058505 [Mycena sp. CBHHK59/15]